MQLNGAMSGQMTAAEIVVLPTRDRIRILLMSGGIIECPIEDVKFVKEDKGKLTLMTKRESDKVFRVIIDTNPNYLKTDYINTELLIAIAHPEVHSI